MTAFTLFDVLATVGFFAAVVCGWTNGTLRRSSRIMLVAFLGVRLFIGIADILEDTGVTEFLDIFEDYAAVLFLPFYVMFLFSLMTSDEMDKRLASEQALRNANEKLEFQYRELLQLDRMKDSFMRNVSHELKTPVAKHAMQIELMEKVMERHGIGSGPTEILDVMRQCVDRQNLVIRNLLELSRLESDAERQVTDLVRVDMLLRRIAEDYSHATAQHGIRVSTDLPETTIRSDRDLLWHVFSNLFSNFFAN